MNDDQGFRPSLHSLTSVVTEAYFDRLIMSGSLGEMRTRHLAFTVLPVGYPATAIRHTCINHLVEDVIVVLASLYNNMWFTLLMKPLKLPSPVPTTTTRA